MAEDKMLQEAIEAVAKGQHQRARDLLTRLLRANQTNPKYWLWMSSVVDTTKERIYCLQNVLRINPNNKAAKLGLVLMGAISPDEKLLPRPITTRNWAETFREIPDETTSKKLIRRIAYFGAGALVIGLISVGFLAPRLRVFGNSGSQQLTITPQFETVAATATLLPTNTPRYVSPTPTFFGPTPLWMLLEATYTPTPLYVNTPHPISEAYRAGLRSFDNGNYTEMLNFMQQAAHAEPESADIHYYIGEAHMLLDDPESALIAYEKAIDTNPNFAPAYLGRAKAMLTLDSETYIEADLEQAIRFDPNLANAHLELIAFHLYLGNYDIALNEISIVEKLSPESPLLQLYRSQAYLKIGEDEKALEAAQQAYELDRTILQIYRILGELQLYTGHPYQASQHLEIYLRYVEDDAEALAIYGRALFERGRNFEEALKAFNRALKIDEYSFSALLYRGLSYVEIGEGQLAVNDLFIARNLDRNSFEASLGLGRALFIAERHEDAVSQFSGSENLSENNTQRAEVYYWRAIAYDALGDYRSASKDLQALLDLPSASIPNSWIEFAQDYIIMLTPTPTSTPSPPPRTNTPRPTSTITSPPTRTTPSPTSSASPTETNYTPTPTSIPLPTLTPRSKR